jgi:hypothetical protein
MNDDEQAAAGCAIRRGLPRADRRPQARASSRDPALSGCRLFPAGMFILVEKLDGSGATCASSDSEKSGRACRTRPYG